VNLKNGTDLFKELVRSPSVAAVVRSGGIYICIRDCEIHGRVDHYYHIDTGAPVCHMCVTVSRALSSVGRAGGLKGGKALTPRKLDQLRAASRAASDRARERRDARNKTGETGDTSHE
jgi:hypothetical protein